MQVWWIYLHKSMRSYDHFCKMWQTTFADRGHGLTGRQEIKIYSLANFIAHEDNICRHYDFLCKRDTYFFSSYFISEQFQTSFKKYVSCLVSDLENMSFIVLAEVGNVSYFPLFMLCSVPDVKGTKVHWTLLYHVLLLLVKNYWLLHMFYFLIFLHNSNFWEAFGSVVGGSLWEPLEVMAKANHSKGLQLGGAY